MWTAWILDVARGICSRGTTFLWHTVSKRGREFLEFSEGIRLSTYCEFARGGARRGSWQVWLASGMHVTGIIGRSFKSGVRSPSGTVPHY
jgi:hypothetical protein